MNKPDQMMKNNTMCKFCFKRFTVKNLVRHNKYCKTVNIESHINEMECYSKVSNTETFMKN